MPGKALHSGSALLSTLPGRLKEAQVEKEILQSEAASEKPKATHCFIHVSTYLRTAYKELIRRNLCANFLISDIPCQTLDNLLSLHIPPARNLNRLPIHITKQRTHNRQHATRRLGRTPRPPQRNILVRAFGRALAGTDLRARNPQRHLLPTRRRDIRPRLLRGRQPRLNVPKRDGVGADAELRAPLLRNRLGHPRHARLRNTVVDLPRVAVRAGGTGDLDDAARLAVFDAEVGRGFAHEAEGRRVVHVDHGAELLVARLVDHAVPRVAGVVDDDVDLAVAEVGGRFDELGEVGRVGHVAGDGDGAVRVRLVDGFGDLIALFCPVERGDVSLGFGLCVVWAGRWNGRGGEGDGRTSVDVADDDFGAFVGEEAGTLCADTLPAAGDDGRLACEQAFGVVEVT